MINDISNVTIESSQKKSIEKTIKLNNFLIAIALTLNFIAATVGSVFNVSNIIPVLSVLIFIISLINNKFKIKYKYLIFVFLTGIFVLWSIINNGLSNNTQMQYILGYIMNVVLICYLVSYNFEFKDICNVIINIFTLFVVSLPFIPIDNTTDTGNLMGWSYSILPLLMVSITYIFNHDTLKKKKVFQIIVINSIYIMFTFSFLTRGVILIIIAYLYLLVILNEKRNLKGIIVITCLLIGTLIIVFNLEKIIVSLNNLFLQNEISIGFLNKIIRLAEQDDIGNGRSEFYRLAWESFQNKPILGNGLGAFARLTNLNYEHSLILQLLNEGGILFSSLHFFMIIIGIIKILKYWDKKPNISKILLFLFCSSVIKLLFTSTFWLQQEYWLYLYLSFSHINIGKSI